MILTEPKKDIAAEIAEFEMKLERLRVSYEQYFMGIEKRQPEVQHKDVVRIMRRIENEEIRNTALRYKYRTLQQKFNTYRNYWNRTLRAIEAGTYHRDVARVRRKMVRQGYDMPDLNKMRTSAEIERAIKDAQKNDESQNRPQRRSAAEIRGKPAEDIAKKPALDGGSSNEWANAIDDWNPDSFFNESANSSSDFATAPLTGPTPAKGGLEELATNAANGQKPSQRSAPPPLPSKSKNRPQPPSPPARPSRPPPPQRSRPQKQANASGLPDDKMDSLYRRYVRAKKMCGEDENKVKRDALERTIQKQLPKLREMHKGKDIDFQVVIRNGKTILKAKVK